MPFELNGDKAHKRKSNKYAPVVTDVRNNGFECDLIAIEIGSRGYISPPNLCRLKSILKLCNNPISFKIFRNNITKIAILSSFTVYHAHKEPSWDDYPTLTI